MVEFLFFRVYKKVLELFTKCDRISVLGEYIYKKIDFL